MSGFDRHRTRGTGEHSTGARSPFIRVVDRSTTDVAEADATMPRGTNGRARSSVMRLKLPGTGCLPLALADG